MRNPYRPGAGTRPPARLGRDALIDHFGVTVRRARAGHPGKSMIPIGLRGVGKTALLNRFAEIAEHEALIVGFIEAPETGDFRVLLANRLRKILIVQDTNRKPPRCCARMRILRSRCSCPTGRACRSTSTHCAAKPIAALSPTT